MAFIGEQFECPNEITGIVLSVGRTDKISIWFRHGYDPQVAPQIKADMIRLLGLPPDVKTNVSVFFPQNNPNQQKQRPQQNRGRDLASYSKPAEETKDATTFEVGDTLE